MSYKATPSLEDSFANIPFVYEGYTINKLGNTYTATETPALKELNTLKDQLYTTYHISVSHAIAGPDNHSPREAADSSKDMAKILETLKTIQSTLARYYTPQEIQQGGLGSIILGKNV